MAALGVIGFLALTAGIIMLIVSAVRKKKVRTWGIVAGLGLVAFIVGMSLSPSAPSPTSTVTEPTPTPAPTATPEPTPTKTETRIKITAKELDQAYWDNKAAADQKYKGKLLEVSGCVIAIDYKYINLEATNSLTPVTCRLRSGQESQLAKLVKGQWATVEGICTGSGFFGVTLEDCFLISATAEPAPSPTPAPTLTPPQLISKDASELVLTIADFKPGWVQQSAEPATKEGAQSAYHVYFYDGSLLPLSPPVIQNTVAVYPTIEQAQQVYLSEVPKNVSLENPKIGDESFLDISISINKRLVFRRTNVVVWVWLQQDMFGDVEPYAKIVEKRISP